MSRKPVAALSLDLDNLWSYQRADGQPGWEAFDSYLPQVVPDILATLDGLGLKSTIFVVGKDAASPEDAESLLAIAESGHSIGNHSYLHEPWMHKYSEAELKDDLDRSEAALAARFGEAPRAFRAPGFSVSPQLLGALARRGYRYDASEFPTFIGPLARYAYFRSAKLSDAEKQERAEQFGKFTDGFGPLRPYLFSGAFGELLEIPVTTCPVLKSPIHLTYLHYLAAVSESLAVAYHRVALSLCRLFRVSPVILLHPLDFVAADRVPALANFPGFGADSERKIAFTTRLLSMVSNTFEVRTLCDFAEDVRERRLTRRTPQSA